MKIIKAKNDNGKKPFIHQDYCEICRKDFSMRHYVWFICLECHKNDPNIAILCQKRSHESYQYRLHNEVELID